MTESDPAANANQAILESVFGDGAEDAVSYEGNDNECHENTDVIQEHFKFKESEDDFDSSNGDSDSEIDMLEALKTSEEL